LVEELGSELASEPFDLSAELAFLARQPLDPPRQGFERELAATQLGVLPAIWPSGAEARQQPGAAERPQLAAQRLGSRDEQVTQLAERGRSRAHRPFACCNQRPQASRSPALRGLAGRF
jgi:hypothetical protein